MTHATSLLAGTLILVGAALAGPVHAQQGPKAKTPKPTQVQFRDARYFRKLRMSGDEVEANVKRLTKELTWHKSVSATLAAARSHGKPALWIQALGDIDGFL